MGWISEQGTIPLPREPLSDRERQHLRELTDALKKIDEAFAQGARIARSGCVAAQLGYDFTSTRDLDRWQRAVWVYGLLAGIRRGAQRLLFSVPLERF